MQPSVVIFLVVCWMSIPSNAAFFQARADAIEPRPHHHSDWRSSSNSTTTPVSLWDLLQDPNACKDASWEYFQKSLSSFTGESGTDRLKGSILSMKSAVHATSSPAAVHLTIDVGANMGQNGRFMIEISRPKGIHLFFEPNPVNWDGLVSAVKDLENCNAYPYAISNYEGSASFTFVHENTVGNQHGHLKKGSDPGSTQVPVTTLDKVLEYFINYEVEMLKIDTEGFDVLVLQGARKVLKYTRLVIFECHLLMRASEGGPGTTHSEAQSILAEFGMETFKIGSGFFIPFTGRFYQDVIDNPKFMYWHNCFAMRPSDPIFKDLMAGRLHDSKCLFKE